jgi:hypothetical protein
MSDAMHKFRDQQRQQQKAAYQEAQRRQAELNATVGEWSQMLGQGRAGLCMAGLGWGACCPPARNITGALQPTAAAACCLPPFGCSPAEDTELPGAADAPPEPSRVATGRLPLQLQAVLLEAWQFVSRWALRRVAPAAAAALHPPPLAV